MADRVVDLKTYRERRRTHRPADHQVSYYVLAEPGTVRIYVAGSQINLSPAEARIWAERLAYLADTAEQLDWDGGSSV